MLFLIDEIQLISIHALLAESDHMCRRVDRATAYISIHALLAESDRRNQHQRKQKDISIHALLAESDIRTIMSIASNLEFLSTLSLRRATLRHIC